MKTNLFSFKAGSFNGVSFMAGLALLIATPLMLAAWGGHAVQKPEADDYRLEGPFTQGNLTVFLIHGKDKIKGQTFITLQEALGFSAVALLLGLITARFRPELRRAQIVTMFAPPTVTFVKDDTSAFDPNASAVASAAGQAVADEIFAVNAARKTA